MEPKSSIPTISGIETRGEESWVKSGLEGKMEGIQNTNAYFIKVYL